MDDTFERVVVDFVKRFTPTKREIFIPPDSLRELKEVVKSTVLASPRSFMTASTMVQPQPIISSQHCGEDEDSRMSGCDSSDSHSVSQYSNDDETSRTSTSAPRRMTKCSSSNSISDIKTVKKSSRAKRMQELRQSRRKAMKTDETHEFTCSEAEFPTFFMKWYNQKLGEQQHSACTLYQIVINSLRGFYAKITWDRNIDSLVLHFLRDHLVKSANNMNKSPEDDVKIEEEKPDISRILLEAQVQVLLELHAISMSEGETGQHNVDGVIKKLRLIYISSDSLKMRVFLDEQVTDCFAHLLPKELVAIFEELCITVPADLEEHVTPDGSKVGIEKEETTSWFPTRKRKNSEQTRQLEKLIEETALTEVKENGRGNANRRKSEARLAQPSQVLRSGEMSPTHSSRRTESRYRPVPETPEEKLLRNRKDQNDEDNAILEVVKQTPMAKIRGCNKKASKRLSELVKLSEERIRPARAAAVAAERATKALMKPSSVTFCSKQVLLGLNSPTNRPLRSARSNLLDRFSYVSSSSSSPVSSEPPPSSSLKRSAKDKQGPSTSKADHKRARTSQTQNTEREQDFGIAGFGVKQLEAYKMRMSELAKSRDPPLPGPPPGGLRTDRRNLFDEAELNSLHVEEGEVQKNRTGRAVRAQTTSVHLAHILLNVHNTAPLEAFSCNKLGAAAPAKLQRLVRTAKKRDMIRLKKLVSRVKMIKEISPSNSQSSVESSSS